MTREEAMINTLVKEIDELKMEIGRLRQAIEQEPCKMLSRIEYGTDGNLYELSVSGGTNKALEQAPCDNAISRQAVNELVDELARAISDERCCISRGKSTATIMRDIRHLPSVTPAEKVGRWICQTANYDTYEYYRCSVCGGASSIEQPYCPLCGAKMQED